jgi:hypothetical protein
MTWSWLPQRSLSTSSPWSWTPSAPWSWTPLVTFGQPTPSLDLAQVIDQVASMCDWSNPDLDTPGTHEAWHYGCPCPYEAVVPALLRGEPDPRRAFPDPAWNSHEVLVDRLTRIRALHPEGVDLDEIDADIAYHQAEALRLRSA